MMTPPSSSSQTQSRGRAGQYLSAHHLHDQLAARFERCMQVLCHSQVVGRIFKVAEGGKEVGRHVERARPDETMHVFLDEFDFKPLVGGFLSGGIQVGRRAVHAGYPETTASQLQRVLARPARDRTREHPVRDPLTLAGCPLRLGPSSIAARRTS